MSHNHGGDIAGFQIKYGKKPLDFSANTSPLGIPDPVRQAAAQALKDSSVYPDSSCRDLRLTLSQKYRVPVEKILCGNGASDLIYRLAAAYRPKKALIPVPTFTEYEAALTLYWCEVKHFFLQKENGFLVPECFPDAITPEIDIVFLCQPNNPTGRTIPKALMERILDQCDRTGTLLAIDECFIDFLQKPEEYEMLQELNHHRLIIFRAFTKFWGMAGLRLGWCTYSDRELLDRMMRSGPPWPVSNAAQAAGIAALQEMETSRKLHSLIEEQRPRLIRQLEECGLLVIPGEANFLLFYGDEHLAEKLCEKGIMIRDCRDFCGLSAGWFRTAVRTEEENNLLIGAIKEIFK